MFFKIENFGKGSLNVLTEAIGPRSRITGRSASDLLHEADLKMYEDKIRTKEEQKAKEKQEKK